MAAPTDPAQPDSPGPDVPEVDSPAGVRGGGLRMFGVVLALIAVGFCVYALARDWDRVAASLRESDPTSLVLAIAFSAASMAWLAVLWQRCLLALGVAAPMSEVAVWYFVGELGKYIPGGVWQVIGRSELAHRSRGVRRSTSYASTLLSYGVMCMGAAALCAVMSPFLATGANGTSWAWIFTPALLLVPAAVHPVVVASVVRVVSKIARRRIEIQPLPWRTMLVLVLWSVPAWFFLGAASAALAHGLGTDANLLRVALAAVAAWVVGFLAVPVPAGAGVREVAFATLSGLAAGPAVAIALLARVVLIAVDALGGLLSIGIQRLRDAQAVRRG